MSQTVNQPLNSLPAVNANQGMFKKIFFASLAIMLGIIWIAGYDSGVGSDEMDMNVYGKANIAYYTSGFKDTTFMNPVHLDGTKIPVVIPNYGSGFDYLAIGLNKLLGKSDGYEYTSRHMLNQLIAIIALLFIGLIAKRIKDYRASIVAIWLTFLTPIFFGLAIFNTKDIPFLAGYIATLYFIIRFLEELPNPSWKTTIGLGLALWFELSIRIGGVLLIAYLGLFGLIYLFKNKNILPEAKNWGLKLVAAIGGSLILTILCWPFVLRSPVENLFKAINVVKAFPQRIPITFEGESISSTNLPASYLTKCFMVSVPVIIIIALLVSIAYLLFNWKKVEKRQTHILILFSGIFPLIYAIYTQMPVYNSWRHLLFIYPSLMVITGAGIIALIDRLYKPAYQWTVVALLAIGLIKPVKWCMENNPYEYTYFNEIAGGFQKAYYEYDTDYWQITVKESIDWLMTHESVLNSKDTIQIATNAYTFPNYYVWKRYPNAKVRFNIMGVKSNFAFDWNYGIFNNLFLDPNFLENNFPSPLSKHIVEIDHMPVTSVVVDNNRWDNKGFMAFNRNDYKLADSLFTLYLNQIHFNPNSPKGVTQLFGMIAFAKDATNQPAVAKPLAQAALNLAPDDFIANVAMGIACIQTNDVGNAQKYLTIADQIKPGEPMVRQYLSLIKTK